VADNASALGDVVADYARRASEFAATETSLERQASRVSNVRLAAFVGALIAALARGSGSGPRTLVSVGLAAAVVVFLIAARRQAPLRRGAAWAGVRRWVCELGAARASRDWKTIASTLSESPVADHPYARDLDVYGHASLARLLDVTSQGPGRRTLSSWLLEPAASVAELRERQASVRETAPAVEWRETLTAHSRTASVARRTDIDRFLTWAEGEPWLTKRPALVWTSRVLPFVIAPLVLLAVGSILAAAGVTPKPDPWLESAQRFARQWWTIPFFVGVAGSFWYRAICSERLQAGMSHLGGLSAYAAMLGHVESAPFSTARLNDLKRRVATGRGASKELARLGTIVRLAEARYSPMAHVALQLLGLWDFHVLAAMEHWQQVSGTHARDWLDALGEAESISALGTLAYDNPAWVMPEFVDGEPRIEASQLGHPLIPAHARVANDVSLGPPGTFLLVTGSNMSGKSTLLRSIGTNVVLAQAGAPVCAESMRLTPMDVWTSIRVDDSLEAGVSLFMAELRRLKRIVDAARDPGRVRPLLYLLDEMLHCTNTAERRIAARRVLGHLINAGAIGAVTTHDLTLAEDPSLDAAAQRVHFTEQFERRDGVTSMTFDYRLREGLATSANALRLLEMIGLGE
jgi:energy-coupling factor transporter ATP-binding protein EcfA2